MGPFIEHDDDCKDHGPRSSTDYGAVHTLWAEQQAPTGMAPQSHSLNSDTGSEHRMLMGTELI